jgi:hypothetical protein
VFVTGLLPDGVASITAKYPARSETRLVPSPSNPRRLERHRIHAPALTVNAPVVDNIVAFTLHRPGELSLPSVVQWRNAAGMVIHTVRERR